MDKAQVFTWDLLIGITIFLLAFVGVVVFLYYSETGLPLQNLVTEGRAISRSVTGTTGVRLQGTNEIDTSKLQDLGQQDYQVIKSQLGVKSDFCIFLVDLHNQVYQFGDRISIGSGSDDVKISGFNCGQEVD